MSGLSRQAIKNLRRAAAEPERQGGRYKLLEIAGRGGMSVVYRAWDELLEREVALKVPHEPVQVERLLDEARVLASLEHPGIVPVHDAGTLPDGRSFYTMKFVRGTPLNEAVRNGMPLDALLAAIERVCEAVAFAHASGVVHRDLKPSNIMTGAFGEVLVLDWGVAATAGAVEEIAGTPGFMAPEQTRGSQAGPAVDIYALGAILHELGRAAPRALRAIASKASAAEPGARYASARELQDDIARFRTGEPASAYHERLHERAARVLARHHLAILLVLTYLVMRATYAFFYHR